MSLSKYDMLNNRHTKARRAIRALAAFGFIISVLLVAFDSVSLAFGIANETVIPVRTECQLDQCYTGAGLWSGVSGLISSTFGLIALRKCKATKMRHAIYFVLCLFASLCNAVAFLLGWACDTNLFDCLRYHHDDPNIEKSLKIMAIMYSCLLLEVFVHMVASNASIGFSLYNCCLSDPIDCDTCRLAAVVRSGGTMGTTTEMINNSIPSANHFELPEQIFDRTKVRMLNQADFPKPPTYATQSLPRYVVLSRGPTNV